MGRQATAKPPRKPGQPLADPIRERYAGQRAMGYSQTAAFRNADPDARRKTDGSVKTMASRMERDAEVQERKREILDDMIRTSDAMLTKVRLAEMISDTLRDAHQETSAFIGASSLVDKYCKMMGYYEPERHEMRVGCLDAAGVEAKVAALLKMGTGVPGG